MMFLSDNAARVHPKVWEAMQRVDSPDAPYDNDALSRELDARFSDLFERECAVLWIASGTAANCLALAAMVPPEGAVICHSQAHIENDECGAPGFYLHGAKLMLVEGEGAKVSPEALTARLDSIRMDVHRVHPHAVSITQATEMGRVYSPDEVARLASLCKDRGLGLHMDGARFANAVAHLELAPSELVTGVDALSFGCVKNGAMNAEAIVFFDPAMADPVRFRRKRAGHLLSKGRFLAAQLLAMLDGDLWLENARLSNAAAQEIGEAAGERLIEPVEANEVFFRASEAERVALRGRGFDFYDWGGDAVRIVTSWDSNAKDVAALAKAISAL